MSSALMSTKEVARYLDIHEKQVYLLIKSGKIPCTKVTGKYIFPVKLIDDWIQTTSQESFQQAGKSVHQIKGALLAAGSNDPVMDMLLTAAKKEHPALNIFSSNTGSVNGLKAIHEGLTDIAFSHLFDPQTGDYNTPYLQQYCPDHHPVVVNLFYREIGFVIAKSGVDFFQGWESLAHPGLRFVNRQQGSGTRMLLDAELTRRGISSGDIPGYDNEVLTHFEVGLSLISGEANAGIASAAVAKILDLHFQPLVSERFDMIMGKDTFFQPSVQTFIKILQSEQLKKRVEKIGNYNFKDSGRILHA
jgi:putative molybdopterin biosynthesis protein